MAVELDQERAIVGDQFGKQRHHEQDHENPERPVTPAVGLEVLPAAAVERRRAEAMPGHRRDLAERRLHRGFDRWLRDDRHQTSRASKSIFFLMIRQPPRSTLFPYTTPSDLHM